MSTATVSAPAGRTATGSTPPANGVSNPLPVASSTALVAGLKNSLSASLAKAFPTTSPEAAPPDEQGSSSPDAAATTVSEIPETSDASPTPDAADAPNVSTGDAEASAEDTADHGSDGAAPSGLTRALKAERAEKKALKAQLKALQAQLANRPEADAPEAAAARPTTEPAQRTPQQEVQHLTQVVGRIKGWIRTARNNPDQVVAELTRLNMPVNAETVDTWLDEQLGQYGDQLMDAKVEERFQREAQGYQSRNIKQTAEQAAAQWVPELEDPESAEAQRFAELQSRHPGLAEDPLATALLAAAVVGFKHIEGKAGKPATNGTAAPRANGAAAAAVILPKRNGASRPTVDGAAAPSGEVTVTAPQLLNRFAQTRDDKDKAAFTRVYGLNLLNRMVRT